MGKGCTKEEGEEKINSQGILTRMATRSALTQGGNCLGERSKTVGRGVRNVAATRRSRTRMYKKGRDERTRRRRAPSDAARQGRNGLTAKCNGCQASS